MWIREWLSGFCHHADSPFQFPKIVLFAHKCFQNYIHIRLYNVMQMKEKWTKNAGENGKNVHNDNEDHISPFVVYLKSLVSYYNI